MNSEVTVKGTVKTDNLINAVKLVAYEIYLKKEGKENEIVRNNRRTSIA